MRGIVLRRSEWLLLAIATTIVLWPQILIPLRGNGTFSFASAYHEVRIGMTWDEWQRLQRRHSVECVCDGTSCYVDDLLRTYNVTFRKRGDEPLQIWSKRVYVHFPVPPSWRLLHR